MRASIDVIERRSTRPDSCAGKGHPKLPSMLTSRPFVAVTLFNPWKMKGTVLVGTGSRSDTITRAQDSDTRSPSIEYVSHTKERPKSNLNYTKRSLEGCNTPLDGSGTHTAGSIRNTRRRKPEHIARGTAPNPTRIRALRDPELRFPLSTSL